MRWSFPEHPVSNHRLLVGLLGAFLLIGATTLLLVHYGAELPAVIIVPMPITSLLGQIFVALIAVLCAFLILRRLNYFTAVLMQQAINNADEGKSTTIITATKLASERELIEHDVKMKLEEAATAVKDTTLLMARQLSAERTAVAESVNQKLDEAAAAVKLDVALAAKDAAQLMAGEIKALREDLKPETIGAAIVKELNAPAATKPEEK